MKPKVAVIVASVRDSRNADIIVDWLKTEMEQYQGELEFGIIDLKDRDIPRFTAAKVPAQRDYDEPTKAWSQEIKGYDGFIVVTPEYNHSYPSALKDAFDHLFHEWTYKPIAFVGYGTDSGVRAVEHLRQVSIQLAMVPIRRQIVIPIWEVVDKDTPHIATRFHGTTQEMFRQLDWWVATLNEARAKGGFVL